MTGLTKFIVLVPETQHLVGRNQGERGRLSARLAGHIKIRTMGIVTGDAAHNRARIVVETVPHLLGQAVAQRQERIVIAGGGRALISPPCPVIEITVDVCVYCRCNP